MAFGFGPTIYGHSDQQIPRVTQEVNARNVALARYDKATIARKFSMSYVSPLVYTIPDGAIHGSGIAGWGNGKNVVTIKAGQSCLEGTAYDTTSYQGRASAVAALSVKGSEVSVYPAGSDADALQFTVVGDKLVADAQTVETLEAYNCRPFGRLPVRTAFDGGSEYKRQWSKSEPLLP